MIEKDTAYPEFCRICGSPMAFFERIDIYDYHRCDNCGFLQCRVTINDIKIIKSGRWDVGGADGGEREYTLTKLLIEECGLNKVLLHGTGYSLAIEKLLSEDYDVYGCDVNDELIRTKQQKLGKDRFFNFYNHHPNTHFDGVVSVEVFEHLLSPLQDALTMKYLLSSKAIIAIETDFYPEIGNLKDRGEYANPPIHNCYWNERGFRELAKQINFKSCFFDMDLFPMENEEILFPNRRVAFLYSEEMETELQSLKEKHPILSFEELVYNE